MLKAKAAFLEGRLFSSQ